MLKFEGSTATVGVVDFFNGLNIWVCVLEILDLITEGFYHGNWKIREKTENKFFVLMDNWETPEMK